MSAPPLSPVAKKGDRISHDTKTAERSTDTLIAALLGHALVMRGNGGALLAQIGAGASCKGSGKATLSITELLPHTTTGAIENASPTVFVAPGAGAALSAADPVDCHNHHDKPIEPGSTSIQVQGLFLARSGAQTGCGAIVCDGAPTVLAGGPAASGSGTGAQGGSPISDAIAYAGKLASQLSATVASVERSAALIEGEIKETLHEVQGTVHGACAAVTGALATITKGGVLGALFGQKNS